MKEKVTVNQRTVRTSAGGNRTAELPPNECNTANLIGRSQMRKIYKNLSRKLHLFVERIENNFFQLNTQADILDTIFCPLLMLYSY